MPRTVPPQVIPRPSTWLPGAPAPWAGLPAAQRTGIGIDRVLEALDGLAQLGPVPAGIGAAEVFDPAILVNETNLLAAPGINAAVLVAIFEEEGEARLILTRRSSGLRTHKGEVSFPGGRLDAGEGPADAALREAHEEVGLDPARVTTVGWIHPVMTMVSASLILPVIATVAERPQLMVSPVEVDRAFDVSLAELAEPGIFHEERWRIPGRTIPGTDDNAFAVRFFEVAGEMIWGATARMLYEFISIVVTGNDGL
jgi:8-oxo-dGTP pyrophosphatase MutT (NUDIX family)